jgi:post-segregation antitoxin (ccd killing protein)
MRDPLFDPYAKKRTVSVTLNGDLYAKAKEHGINASQVAEAALAEALAASIAATARMEIHHDLAVYDEYVEKHGSPAEMLRDHLAKDDDAA